VLSAKAKDALVGKDLSADELVGRVSKREVIQSASSSTPSSTKGHLASIRGQRTFCSKSEWMTPAAAGALMPFWTVQARTSCGPQVK